MGEGPTPEVRSRVDSINPWTALACVILAAAENKAGLTMGFQEVQVSTEEL